MPTHDYTCPKCGAMREVRLKRGDNAHVKCDCKGVMQKEISHPNIQFKGSGFYSTTPN